MLQARGLEPARHDGVARVPAHRGLRAGGSGRPRGGGGGGGARAAAGEALRPPLGRQLGGWGRGAITRVPGPHRRREIRRRRIPDLRAGGSGMRAPDLRRANWEWEIGGRGRGRRELWGRGWLAGCLRFFISFFLSFSLRNGFAGEREKAIKGVAKGGCKLEFSFLSGF